MKYYNVKIKQKNNNEWNTVYPHTKAKNVSLSNGNNLEEVNTNINKEITNLKTTKVNEEELNTAREELNTNISNINREIISLKTIKASKEELNTAKEETNQNITDINEKIALTNNNLNNTKEEINTNINYIENSLNNFITYKNLFETEFIGGYVDENGNQQVFESENYKYAMTKDFISIHNSKEVQIEFTLDNNIPMDIHITCIHLYDKNKNYIGNISDKKIKSDNNHKVYIMKIDKEDVEYIIPIFKCVNSESTEYEYSQSSFINYLNSINFLLMMPLIEKEKINNIEELEYNIYNVNNQIKELNKMTKTKNIFNTIFEQGSIRISNGLLYQDYNNPNKYVRAKDMIKIEPNNNLVVQYIKEDNNTFPFYKINILGYDNNKNYIGKIDASEKTENNITIVKIFAENVKNIEYLRILFVVKNDFIETNQVDFANSINFQIEYGINATEYSPCELQIKKEKTEGLIELESTINDLTTDKIILNISKDNIESGAVSIRTGRIYNDINFIRVRDYIKLNGEKIIVLQRPKYSDETIKNINIIGYSSDDSNTFIENIKKIENIDNEYIYYNIPISKEIKYIRLSIKINSNKIKENEDTSDEVIKENIQNVIEEIDQMKIELKSFKIKKEKVEDFIELEEKSETLNDSIKELKDITKRNTNIFDGIFEEGAISTATGNKFQLANYSIRSKNFIEIDNEIEKLTFQRSIDDNNIVSGVHIIAYNSEKKFIKKLEIDSNYIKNNKRCYNVTLSNDIQIKYIKFGIIFTEEILIEDTIINDNGEEEKITKTNTEGIEKCKEYIKSINFQIEYGLEATDYIPYKLYIKKDNVENFNELEEKVEELFTSVSSGKELLETAITDKGGIVSKNDTTATFNELKDGINSIKTGINIFSQTTKPSNNDGIWIKNDKIYENIDFFDSSKDTTFKNEKMNNLIYNLYTSHRTLTIGNEIYILMNFTNTSDNSIKSYIYKYNTENDIYEAISSISDNTSCYFHENCATSIGDYIYLFGLKDLQDASNYASYKYNIKTCTYTKLNSTISINTGSFAIVANNDNIYLFSGTKLYLYNTSTDSYETLEDIPYDCRYGAGILVNDNIYVFGGPSVSNNVAYSTAYKYNISNRQFTKLKDIPFRFARNNIIKIDNYIYLFGSSSDYKTLDGELNAYETYKKSYRYNINSDSYERISDVPYDILVKRVELVGNNIYILGSNTTTNKKYNIKLTKKELMPNSILFMNTQIVPRYNVKLYNTDCEKMNNFSFYELITTDENSEIETTEKYINNGTSWVKI